MARNISLPPPPVKTATQRAAEQRATDARFKARVREHRQAEQAKPLRQSLAGLLAAAGVQ